MPIDIEAFEDAEAADAQSTSERIIGFLASHPNKAYRRREIADAIDAEPETVGTNLTRLKRRGLVRHREPYWAFTEDFKHARGVLESRYGEGVLTSIMDSEPVSGSPTAGRTDPPASGASSTGPARADSRHREAAGAFAERVEESLTDEVEALYLFGSVADASATDTSDVDVLAVIANDADYEEVDDRLLYLAYDVQLEHGVRVEVHAVRAEGFADRKAGDDPFVRAVVQEGHQLV